MGSFIFYVISIALICLSFSHCVSAFAPLGSEPVERCEIHSYECPSHYICVAYDGENYGQCTCDRFYGFYGPTCEKLSVASYMLMGTCITTFILMSRALLLNLKFAFSLHRTGSLQQNALCRCLFFNILTVLPVAANAVGSFVVVVSIDQQMAFHEYLLYPVFTCFIVTFILSTMSISLAWIETVEKNRRRGNHSHWKYKLLLYGNLLFTVIISIVSFRFSLFSFVVMLQVITVSFSYFQANRIVTEALSVMEDNGDIVVYQGASDVLHSIKQTSKKMMFYSLLYFLSSIITVLTTTLKKPLYEGQNSLPRYTQGQLGSFMTVLSLYKINMTLLQYLKSSARKQLARSVINRTCCQSLKAFCSCLCCWSSYCKDDNDTYAHQHVELVNMGDRAIFDDDTAGTPNSTALSTVDESSQNSVWDATGNNKESNVIAKVEHIPATDRNGNRTRSSSSMQQLALSESTALRRLLSSLFSPSQEATSNSADSHMPSQTPFAFVTVDLDDYQSQARLVADTGGGRLADYAPKYGGFIINRDPAQRTNETGGVCGGATDRYRLVAGSHAFVKCYGEPFIRCCLDSFRFGCAVGHESLARSNSGVLLAGEIEVNEEGIVTRWLNKSGLHIPPQWVLSQSGLPFELAWLYLSEHEVGKIELHRRVALQSSSALVNLLDSTDDTEDQSGVDCRCASCVRIRHGAADSTVNQQQDILNVQTGNGLETSPLVCERRKRFDGLGAVGSDGQSSYMTCSWVLKASADIGNSWQLPMGTSAYVHTKEAVARVRHMMGGSLVEKSNMIVPSDMLYDSLSSPISELTEFSDAELDVRCSQLNRIDPVSLVVTPVVNRRNTEHKVGSSLNIALSSGTSRESPSVINNVSFPLSHPLDTSVPTRGMDTLQLQQDEESVSDMSSITMSSTASQQCRDSPTPYVLRVPSQVAELNNEDSITGGHDSAEGVEQDGISLSDVFLSDLVDSASPTISDDVSFINLELPSTNSPPLLNTTRTRNQTHSSGSVDTEDVSEDTSWLTTSLY